MSPYSMSGASRSMKPMPRPAPVSSRMLSDSVGILKFWLWSASDLAGDTPMVTAPAS